METLTGGPAGGRCGHDGGTRGAGDVFLQNDIDVRVHHLAGKTRKKGGRRVGMKDGKVEIGWRRTILTKEIVKLVGSVETVSQATF